MKLPLVSIILVTYNSEKYITNCLKAIFAISYPHFELIIVDNNSKDRSVKIIQEFQRKYKNKITCIKEKNNLGYAKANNLAVNSSSGEFIFILNPDTIVSKNFLEPLISETTSKEVAAVQPLVYLFDKKTINLTGKITHYLGFDWLKDFNTNNISKKQRIYSLSGSGILIRKSDFDKSGGFDEFFFMYYEDTDLSWKFNLLNKKIIFSPESILFHDYKYLPDEKNQKLTQKLFYIERNRIITLLKNYSNKTLFLIFPVLIFMELGMILFAFYEGWGMLKIKTYGSILKNWHKIKEKRRFIQKQRIISDTEIMENFESTITFEKFSNPIIKNLVNPFLHLYFLVIKRLV